MSELFIFLAPLDAHCELLPDPTGEAIVAVPYVHPSGRPGQSFHLPEHLPDQNGAQLTIAAKGYVPFVGRGVLHLHPEPFLAMDDFHLVKGGGSLPRLVLNGQFLGQVDQ